jgi:glutathione synthase/RimK-type ligase-like ATP-grasp enzyme
MYKKILISNARSFISLDFARFFNSLGIEVFVVDSSKYHICSFSNAVKKSFLVPSPRFETKKYIEAILEIVKEEKIDLIIPIYEEIFYISKFLKKFPESCKVFCTSFEVLEKLHNKWTFQEKVKSFGFKTPKTYFLKNSFDFKNMDINFPFVLKACYSRASQKVKIIENENQLREADFKKGKNFWIVQEFLDGKKYSTYSVCWNGRVKAHVTYPLNYSIANNSCLSFKSVKHEKIFKWVEKFVELENFTGQIGFDFIERGDGLFAIECNPRATSGAHLLVEEDGLKDIFLDSAVDRVIFPTSDIVKQIAPGMVLYGWKKVPFFRFLRDFFGFKDIVFDKGDIFPFLFQPFLFSYYYLNSFRLKKSFPAMFTHDIDYNGFFEGNYCLED